MTGETLKQLVWRRMWSCVPYTYLSANHGYKVGWHLVDRTEGEVCSSDFPHLRRLKPQLRRLSGDVILLGPWQPLVKEALRGLHTTLHIFFASYIVLQLPRSESSTGAAAAACRRDNNISRCCWLLQTCCMERSSPSFEHWSCFLQLVSYSAVITAQRT